MSKKVVNLGKVKGRTLDLKVEDNIIKKKYDDEAEWEDLVEVPDAGVSVVDTVNDLPTDAKEDSVAFVKNEVFIETIEHQEEIPIVSEGGEHILNFELKQDMIQFSGDNLKDIHPELSDENTSINLACEIETSDDSIDIEYYHYPPAAANEWLGVNHSIDFCMFETYEADGSFVRWINLKGMSAKDFVVEVMGLPLPDAYLQILCGERYGDETADNPSYGWVKQYETSYPLNENSLPVNGIYATIVYDAVVDCKLTGLLDYFYIKTYDANGEEDIYLSVNLEDPYKVTQEEVATALSYANTFTNFLFRGGIKHTSQDIYGQKGFHIYENEKWKSLEEKMNIPKVVEKHSDLPKSFIENGIMVVANEEIVEQPTTKLEASVPVSIKINPTPSVKDEVEKIKQHLIQNGFSADKGWNNYVLDVDVRFTNEAGENIAQLCVNTDHISENDFDGIQLQIRGADIGDTGYYIVGHYYYFDEAGAEIYLPGTDSSSSSSIYVTDEGKCWYYVEYRDNGKNGYLHTPPRKVEFDDWFELSKSKVNSEIYITAEVKSGGHVFELDFYDFASLLKVYDSSKNLICPKGFYMYAKNQWWHQPEIAGDSFDNTDVLRTITEEDVGNIHTHDNKRYLDGIISDDYVHHHVGLEYATRNYSNYIYKATEITEESSSYLRIFSENFNDIYLFKDYLDISVDGYNLGKYENNDYSKPIYLVPECSFAVNVNSPSGYADINIETRTSYDPYGDYVTYMGYAKGEKPIFESGYRYEFSILDGIAVVGRTPLRGG